MEVHFEMLPADLAAFQRYWGRHQTLREAFFSRAAVLGVLIALQFFFVPVVLHWYMDGLELGRACLWLWGGQLVFWVAVFLVVKVNTNTYKTRFKGSNKEIRMAIDPERLHYFTPRITQSLLWKAIEKIGVTKNYAFFFIQPNAAFVLPCRAFADREAFQTFVDTARRFYDGAKAFRDEPYEETA